LEEKHQDDACSKKHETDNGKTFDVNAVHDP